MKFFIDSVDISEIKKLADIGLVDGVTTNPSLVAKSDKTYTQILEEITSCISGPVSAEVISEDYYGMVEEARNFAGIAENIVVKLPLTVAGIRACTELSKLGIKTNLTLCFSSAQAMLAAKAGATFISPFVGRLDDLSQDGMQLIEEIVNIYLNYEYIDTQVLVASVRSPAHVVQAASIGADIATISPKIMWQMFNHPLTDKGLAQFLADYNAKNNTQIAN